MELSGSVWHVITYPMYSFFDKSQLIGYFWALAVPCKDGFRRNETMYYSTCEALEQVREQAAKSGYELV
jgi:hypothetical protein